METRSIIYHFLLKFHTNDRLGFLIQAYIINIYNLIINYPIMRIFLMYLLRYLLLFSLSFLGCTGNEIRKYHIRFILLKVERWFSLKF